MLRNAVAALVLLSSTSALAMDRDSLGTIRSVDRCPDAVETPNGFADHDGCPDTAPGPDVRVVMTRLQLQPIYFAAGAADVSEFWQVVLAQAVWALRRDPSLCIELVGHANSRERTSPAGRVALAQRRAEQVRATLVRRHGVDPARLVVRAAGDSEPIDSNATANGRRVNSRVSFTMIVGATR